MTQVIIEQRQRRQFTAPNGAKITRTTIKVARVDVGKSPRPVTTATPASAAPRPERALPPLKPVWGAGPHI